MFVPPIAKAQPKTSETSASSPAHQRSTPSADRAGDGPAELPLMLQRAIGNQGMLRLLAAWPRVLQRKLAIGRTDDPLEHEADRVADQVMRMPAPAAGSPLTAAPPQVSRKCAECEEEEEKLQRKEAGAAAHSLSGAPAIVHEVLRSPGQPLDAATRAFFEPRFGRDFSSVRVHTGTAAVQSARDVNAHAYTVGQNIVFANGQYAPTQTAGRRLVAHELAHVIQQNRGGSERPALRAGALEQAAESAATAFVEGQSSICVSGVSAPGLARQPVPGGEEKKPRSLRESLKAGALTDSALAEEIDLISEWLPVNPSSGAEYKQLSGELDRLEGEQWRRTQKAEKKQKRQEQIAKVVKAVEAGRIPDWLPVFPFLPSHGLGALMPWDLEFDAAPIMARREGESIVVQQPINSVKNTRRFAKDVRSIEHNVHGNVFSNQGGRLRPDDLVGVRLYDEGEKVIVVEARQLLEFARASDRAVYTNIVATALSAGSGAIAGNVARSVATRSFVTRLAVNTATGTGLGFATGAASSAIVDAGYVYSGDISGGQLFSNAWEAGKTGAKYGAAFSAGGMVLGAGVSRFSPNAKLPAPEEGATARPTPQGSSGSPTSGALLDDPPPRATTKPPVARAQLDPIVSTAGTGPDPLAGAVPRPVDVTNRGAFTAAPDPIVSTGGTGPDPLAGAVPRPVDVTNRGAFTAAPPSGGKAAPPAASQVVPSDTEFDAAFARLESGQTPDQGAMLGDLMFHGQRGEAVDQLRAQVDPNLRTRPGRTPDNVAVNPQPGYQSAHTTAQSALRNLPTYNPDAMITRLLPTGRGQSHTVFDQFWQAEFRQIRQVTGRTTTTAQELFEVTERAARQSGAFTPAEAESMVQLIYEDLYVNLRLSPNQPLRMPGT